MDELCLDVVEGDDIETFAETISNGFRDVPAPPDVVPYEATPLAIALRDGGGAIAGGVAGHTAWDWLYVKLLWVAEAHLGGGHGKRLLDAAENMASERGCVGVWLNTHEFQVPAFYERQGYERFGEIENFPKGHRRLFYKKHLAQASPG